MNEDAGSAEQLHRLARVRKIAAQIFANEQATAAWLEPPAPALNGARPIDSLDTDAGVLQDEDLLRGIAHGHIL
jgi:putative toxin-antitoxin system antitoxin component (TIGR02293 family)